MPHSNMIQPHFSRDAVERLRSPVVAWASVSSTMENSSSSSRPNSTLDFSNGIAVMAQVPMSANGKVTKQLLYIHLSEKCALARGARHLYKSILTPRLQVMWKVGGELGKWHKGKHVAAVLLIWPVESRPRSWLWIRWMLSLAAISLPFSMPALERREPEDWGCILVAEAYFSNMTDGRPCSVVLGVSSTIPLKQWGKKKHVWISFWLWSHRCV